MSRLIAYFGSDPERVECGLAPARQALVSRSSNPLGWGLGFVQSGDVLLQKRPRIEAFEVDFFLLAKDLRADALIGSAVVDGEGRLLAENMDPHRFRSWLFGCVGVARGFDQVRERVLDSIPDFLRRNIRGASASVYIFHLFLAFLHDAGLLEVLVPPPLAVERALRESVAFIDKLLAAAGAPKTQLALVASNGRSLAAHAHGHTMQFLRIAGITDCTVCRDRQRRDEDNRRVAHESFRALIVEADVGTPARVGWQQVADDGAITVAADHTLRTT